MVPQQSIDGEQDGMSLADGYTDVPDGKIASVVTHLQMLEPTPLRPEQQLQGIEFGVVKEPTGEWYRSLYAHVGAQDWLWFSRLLLSDDQLGEIIRDPKVELYRLRHQDNDEGLLELDFRKEGQCELAFFGVSKNLLGTGAGRFLMNRAIEIAWSRDIQLFHVHTCTLDHPGAIEFYQRSGFVAYRRQIEIVDDPRLTGLLPESAAPHVPVIR
jgi:GNAT superfamily N-acetyltransferase